MQQVHLQLKHQNLVYFLFHILWISGEKPKPNPIPYDDALGGKKYKIKLVGHRVEKGTGEEGKDKLLVAVLYTHKTSLVRVSEFVKAPDVLREYLNAAERQVAKTVYLWMAEVPVKLNPTLLERIAEAKLLSAPKHILMDNTEKGSGTSSTKFFSLLGGTKGKNNISIVSNIFSVILNSFLFFQLLCRRKEIFCLLKSKEITRKRNRSGT